MDQAKIVVFNCFERRRRGFGKNFVSVLIRVTDFEQRTTVNSG